MSAYDVIVIGGGPGGYVAAIRAAQLGLKTAVVERAHLGGICLNWGCIPTKALLRSAEIFHYAEHAQNYGLKISKPSFEIADIVKRSRNVSAQLNGGVGLLLKKNKVDVIWGEAKIAKAGTVQVSALQKQPRENPPAPKGTLGEGTYQAKHIIIATGARPRVLPGIEPDGDLIWTYFEAMVPKT
ncbi:MAG: FAD-dependent oxidoreductase, partial [Pseudomonadota bacterium]